MGMKLIVDKKSAHGERKDMLAKNRKIKPCPFCGNEVTLISTSARRAFIFSHKGIRNCPFYNFEISWETAKTLDEATALWNRRANHENLN